MLVDLAFQRHDSIDMVVRSSQDRGPRRCADRVGDIAVVEHHTLHGEPIYVGRVIDARAVGTDGLGRMVVGKDEDDVGALLRHSCPSRAVFKRAEQQ